MLIDAVTVCVGYADFLRETLPVNLPHLNRLVVVTTPDDHEMIQLCLRYSVECRTTRSMTAGGAKFAKARGISHGLAYLASTNWILHFDADIAFPPDMKRSILRRPLNESFIYGADRVYCPNYEEWNRYLASDRYQFRHHYRIDPPGFPIASRVSIVEHDGYIPIGFFQLWHASRNRRYPLTQNDGAEHTDVLHAIQWEPEERHLLPEFFVVHLDSGRSREGANWKGRTTPRFGPAPIASGQSAHY